MLTVQIWSDIVCPWCYLGRLNWMEALSRVPGATDRVRTRWRSFELRPDLPAGQGDTLVEIIRRDWDDLDERQMSEVFDRIRGEGATHGRSLRPEAVRPVNTFDAHRLLHLAAGSVGDCLPLMDLMFDAYHNGIRDLSDHAVLAELAVRAGLDPALVADLLAGDRFADAVRADEAAAPDAGVTAVPGYRIADVPAVCGAVPPAELARLLDAHLTADAGT